MCYRFIKIIFGQVTQNTSRIAYHAKHAVISTIGEPIYQVISTIGEPIYQVISTIGEPIYQVISTIGEPIYEQ
jgi:phage-related protein